MVKGFSGSPGSGTARGLRFRIEAPKHATLTDHRGLNPCSRNPAAVAKAFNNVLKPISPKPKALSPRPLNRKIPGIEDEGSEFWDIFVFGFRA